MQQQQQQAPLAQLPSLRPAASGPLLPLPQQTHSNGPSAVPPATLQQLATMLWNAQVHIGLNMCTA